MEAYKDEEWLRHEYVDKERNATDIADDFDVHHQNIYYYLDKFDIERRTRGFDGGEDHPNYSGGKSEYECTWCGKPFLRRPGDVKKVKYGPYCSKPCHYAHKSVYFSGEGNHQYGVTGEDNATHGRTGKDHPMFGVRGEDHPNWKGGYDQSWRQGPEWRNARRRVFDRDGEECVECGMTRETHEQHFDRDLEVHHITPVSEGGAKYELENLEALCQPCHAQKHREL